MVSDRDFEVIYKRPESVLTYFPAKDGDKTVTHYCPGCGHGILHRIVGSAIDKLGIREDTIMLSPVGCAVFLYYYFNTDHIQAPHGRAPAVAVGAKRYLDAAYGKNKKIVISYQGDGDLAAIGTAEIINAAQRGDNITVIFVNNSIYGMTGGQRAPTTLPGMKTTTTPYGNDPKDFGEPFRISEMIAVASGSYYIERCALFDAKHIMKTQKAVEKAIKVQIEGKGFSLVEVLSNCPTNWKMDAISSMDFVKNEMTKYFPIGIIKDKGKIVGDLNV